MAECTLTHPLLEVSTPTGPVKTVPEATMIYYAGEKRVIKVVTRKWCNGCQEMVPLRARME